MLVDTVGFLQDLPHNLIEAFKSTLESAIHCDLALIVCDATGEYDMQLQTTLQTLEEMQFSSPYIVVMNKSENCKDESVFPFGSVAISAKNHLGIERLQREIFQRFANEYLICELFIPYAKSSEYAKNKHLLIERNTHYTDDGQIIEVTIPMRYSELFQSFIQRKN